MARKETLAKIEEVLKQRREAIKNAMAGDHSLLEQMQQSGGVGDVVDFASDSSFGEISSQLIEVASRELRSIEVALKRMKAGNYGKCELCNCNIGLPRIQALPYATLCISCQRENEQKGSNRYGDPDWGRVLDVSSDEPTLPDLDIRFS
ncbi:MAG: TraR/DksA C4-type zinc finger protein [Pirellulaceae bacterium]|jgi:DnaK suppressor protein|nr:TraR/DksA C4-type zinc finger protein [Pirellulaceae bacterium]